MVTNRARELSLTGKNQLDGFLSCEDPRVVLDTTELFLDHAKAIPSLQDTILLRIRNPLLGMWMAGRQFIHRMSGVLASKTDAPEALQLEALDAVMELCRQGKRKFFESEVDLFLPKR